MGPPSHVVALMIASEVDGECCPKPVLFAHNPFFSHNLVAFAQVTVSRY